MQLHVKYIRSLEDSDRVRAACITYLENWLTNFYPERPDIVQELQGLAKTLGGRLRPPRLRWKYAWIELLFGWRAAKSARTMLQQLRASLVKSWDKVIYQVDKSVKNITRCPS